MRKTSFPSAYTPPTHFVSGKTMVGLPTISPRLFQTTATARAEQPKFNNIWSSIKKEITFNDLTPSRHFTSSRSFQTTAAARAEQPKKEEERYFHIADILTIVTGKFLSLPDINLNFKAPDGTKLHRKYKVDSLHDITGFVWNEQPIFNHSSYLRFLDTQKEILKQFPQFKDWKDKGPEIPEEGEVDPKIIKEWLAPVIKEFGEWHKVSKPKTLQPENPFRELMEARSTVKVDTVKSEGSLNTPSSGKQRD